MKNMNLNNIFQWPLKQQLMVLVFIFLLVFYGGYYFDISSQRTKLAEVKTLETDLKQQLTMAIQKEEALKADIENYANLSTLFTDWKLKLINYSQLPTLMNEILKIGANNHITFTLFKPLDEVPADPYVKEPIQVVATGSYHQLADFLSQVANMKNIVVVNAFIFSNENTADVLGEKLAKVANEQNLLTAKIALEIYMLGSAKPVQAKPKPEEQKPQEQKTEEPKKT